jgi:hypothetical protein
MEQAFQINPNEINGLEAQIRECFGRVVYSTKTHEKCADLCVRKLGMVKFWQIVLSALTTGGLVTAGLGDPKVSQIAVIVSALLSTMLLVLNAYMKEVDLGQQAEKHKKTASELWDIRESYLSILTDLRDGHIDNEKARTKRDELQARLVSIYAAAPRTLPQAYKDASTGLKEREELSFSDEEIDAFLPKKLRRGAGCKESHDSPTL